MHTFRTERSLNRYFIKQLLLIVLIFTALVILDYFDVLLIKNSFSYYVIPAVSVLINLYFMITDSHLQAVLFDTKQNVLKFEYRTLFNGEKIYKIPFDVAGIDIKKVGPGWLTKRSRLELYFKKGNYDMFELSSKKDGFTEKTLEEIAIMADELSLQVRIAKYPAL